MGDLFPTKGEMSRKHRILVGSVIFGLYVLGFAVTDSEKIDEDCRMDNACVPRHYEDLREKDRKYILENFASCL